MTNYQRRTRSAFLLVLLVPIVLGMLSFLASSRHSGGIAEVAHTQDVLNHIDDIIISITIAESSQRGFLLTDDPVFLAAYRRSYTRVQEQVNQLRQLIVDNPTQIRNSERLSGLLNQRLTGMETVLRLRQAHALPPASATTAIRQGREVMRAIRTLCREMEIEEGRLLAARQANEKRSRFQIVLCIAIGIVLNIGLVYWAFHLMKQYGISRDRSDLEIRQLNAELENRVRERTAELEAANAQLSRSNDDLTRFAYVASHDLQEPLRTIGSYAGLIARRYQGKLDDQADKYIEFLIGGAKRMQTLVQDLLAYSRAGTQALTLTTVDLNQVLADTMANLRLTIAECKAKIIASDLPSVDGDAAKLALVFQNLIGNAIKFRKADVPPEVNISAVRSQDGWTIKVRDNGIGFEPQYADRIFVIFQRLHHVGAYPGTGIGLAICKRIIEGHGGRISVTSEPGIGSEFTFLIPERHRSNTTQQPATVALARSMQNTAGRR